MVSGSIAAQSGDHWRGGIAIATTSPELAVAALDALAAAGVGFAVLHNEEAILNGTVAGDIDIAVNEPGRRVLERSNRILRDAGLIPVVIWPYNLGGLTVFLMTGNADRGVQLDMLFDTGGRGRYGLRSEAVLRGSRRGMRWPVPDRDVQLAYLLRKRQLKGDPTVLTQLVSEAAIRWPSGLPSGVEDALSSVVAKRIGNLLAGRPEANPGPGLRHTIRNGPRIVNRISRPIGFWVELFGDGSDREAEGLIRLFGRVLPHVGWSARPEGMARSLSWWGQEVVPVKWRPGLFVSTSERESTWADLSLEAQRIGNPERLVAAMTARLVLESP